MGLCASVDSLDISPDTEPPLSIAERQRSLIDFVRALSEPSINSTRKESSDTISSVTELTPAQEAFLSRHKMLVYGLSDPIHRASTFENIEEDFYNTYHKKLLRKVLYELYKLR